MDRESERERKKLINMCEIMAERRRENIKSNRDNQSNRQEQAKINKNDRNKQKDTEAEAERERNRHSH